MKIRRRFPNCSTFFEESEHEINTKEELLNLQWVKEYNDIDDHIGMFYSPKGYPDGKDFLMSVSKSKETGEFIYFVVGYIYGDATKLGLENYLDYITTNKI